VFVFVCVLAHLTPSACSSTTNQVKRFHPDKFFAQFEIIRVASTTNTVGQADVVRLESAIKDKLREYFTKAKDLLCECKRTVWQEDTNGMNAG
jgi:hypothetical protein